MRNLYLTVELVVKAVLRLHISHKIHFSLKNMLDNILNICFVANMVAAYNEMPLLQ